MWSHKVSSNVVAAVFGSSASYLSITSNAIFTNSSGYSFINWYSLFVVIRKGYIISVIKDALDSWNCGYNSVYPPKCANNLSILLNILGRKGFLNKY